MVSEDNVVEDTIKASPFLSEEKKRPSSTTNSIISSLTRRKRQSTISSIGCFAVHKDKFFEVVAEEDKCNYSLKSEVDDAKAQTDAVSKAKVTRLKKSLIININYKSILNEI
jgi:hypothetical protein